jgi:FAD/FMN-containing dehydrogenase
MQAFHGRRSHDFGTGHSEIQGISARAIVRPGETGYDAARTVPNAMINRQPAIIARCAGAADVIACVRFAREHDVLVSVRGGGHSVAGKSVCDGGLMIDLSAMKGIRVDPVGRTVRAEPGLKLGEFDRETAGVWRQRWARFQRRE